MDSEYHSTAQMIKLKKKKWQKKAYYRFSHDLEYNQKEVPFSWAWVGLERKWKLKNKLKDTWHCIVFRFFVSIRFIIFWDDKFYKVIILTEPLFNYTWFKYIWPLDMLRIWYVCSLISFAPMLTFYILDILDILIFGFLQTQHKNSVKHPVLSSWELIRL